MTMTLPQPHRTRSPLAGQRALILGGGPAGLSLALSLHQRGCLVRVHEQQQEQEQQISTMEDSNSASPIFSDKGFGYLLMPNGVAALDDLGVKQGCLARACRLEMAEIYKRELEVEKVGMEGIYCLARGDLIAGIEQMLPEECVIKSSRVVEIITEGMAEQTVVSAVKVVDTISGQEMWLRLRQRQQPHEEDHTVVDKHDFDDINTFDYIFAADGVNSMLAKCLNPDIDRNPGGLTNTIVTCVRSENLAQQLSTRFIKTYFRNKTKKQCCAFGLLSPASGMIIGFMQFSTILHGQAPYNSKKNLCKELLRFIEDVLALPSSSSTLKSINDEPENIALLRKYLIALSVNEYDYHVWRFVPSGYVRIAHGINCAMLGDAAHPMSDFSSQGLSLAVEDAVSLGNHLVEQTAMGTGGIESVCVALANYDNERRSVVSRFIVAGDLIHGNFLSECDDDDDDGILTEGKLSERLIDGVDQPFTVHGQVRRLSSLSSRCSNSTPQELRVSSDFDSTKANQKNDEVFLDPTLVNLETLSKLAYNYRWATLPDGVIPLTAASSDFPVSSAITRALKNHVDAGYFCYGPNEGLPQFREAFAVYFSEKLARGLASYETEMEENSTAPHGASSIDPGQVMATNAAAAAVYAAAVATIIEPGDEALVMSPVDFLLVDSVIAVGGVVIRYSIKERQHDGGEVHVPTFDLVEMETLITHRTRILSICNPHNPIGRSFSYRELRELVNFAQRHKLCIVSDEVWCDIVHAPRVHIPTMCVSHYAALHTYTIFGFSKSHGLEGLRIGALVAPDQEKLEKVLMLSNTNTTANGASVAAQIAAVAAMTEAGSHDTGWLASWRLHLHACVTYTVKRLNAMEGVIAYHPEATFVVWADVSRLLYPKSSRDNSDRPSLNIEDNVTTMVVEPEFVLMQWLIREHKVAIIPGLDRFFGPGSAGHIRLSVATSKPILESALDRLELGLKIWPTVREKVFQESKVEAKECKEPQNN